MKCDDIASFNFEKCHIFYENQIAFLLEMLVYEAQTRQSSMYLKEFLIHFLVSFVADVAEMHTMREQMIMKLTDLCATIHFSVFMPFSLCL